MQTGRCLSTITHEDKVNAVAFSPCGNFIVTAPDIEVTIPNVNPKLSPAYIWELPWVIHPAFYKKPLRLNHILLIELIHQLGKNTPWNNELLALFKQLTSVQQAELNQRYDLKLLNTTPSSGAETTTTTTTIRSPITTSASTPTPANSPISSPATIVEHITPEERNTDEDEPKPQEKKHKSSTSTSTSDDEEEFEHKGKKGRSSKSAQLSASN